MVQRAVPVAGVSRRYGDSGCPEDPRRCQAEIAEPPHWIRHYQCSRRRGASGLCYQHDDLKRRGGHVSVPEDKP